MARSTISSQNFMESGIFGQFAFIAGLVDADR
jgi:hypothetical protein